ncbi:MAG: peptide ABC transporter substrate-binding protein [Chloroflexia bacterium]
MSTSFKPQALIALAGMALLLVVLAATSEADGVGSAARKGDTYVEAITGPPRFVNPLLALSDTDRDLTHLVFSGLTRIDPKGNLVPDLASGWEVSQDSRVYTFTLKPDAQWHDGAPLTADDMLFTFGLLRVTDFPGDPALAIPWSAVQPKAPTQQIVTFELPTPNASFIQFTTLGILPRHLWGSVKPDEMRRSELNLSPVGSGPWRYVRSREAQAPEDSAVTLPDKPAPALMPPGEGVLLQPFPVGSHTSPISRLWFRLYPSFGAALTGFRLGEVHGLGHIPNDRLEEVRDTPGVSLLQSVPARYSMLLMNTRSPLFDRVETRQAFALAIDRQAIATQALDGRARPAVSPLLLGSWAFDSNASLSSHSYNPTEARRLLDTAGWKSGADGVRVREGVTLTVVLSANADVPANVEVALQLEGYLRAIGVDVKPAYVSREALLRDYLGPRAFHVALATWEAQGADPDVYRYWHSSQISIEGGLNFSGWANPQADAALEATRLSSDKAERKRHYLEFQKAFLQDVPAVILTSPLYTYAIRQPATGVSLPPVEILDPSQRFDTLFGWSLQARGWP